MVGRSVIHAEDTDVLDRAGRTNFDRPIPPTRSVGQSPVVEWTRSEDIEHLLNDALVYQRPCPSDIRFCTIRAAYFADFVETRIVQGANEFIVEVAYVLNAVLMNDQVAIQDENFIESALAEESQQRPHVSNCARILVCLQERDIGQVGVGFLQKRQAEFGRAIIGYKKRKSGRIEIYFLQVARGELNESHPIERWNNCQYRLGRHFSMSRDCHTP